MSESLFRVDLAVCSKTPEDLGGKLVANKLMLDAMILLNVLMKLIVAQKLILCQLLLKFYRDGRITPSPL